MLCSQGIGFKGYDPLLERAIFVQMQPFCLLASGHKGLVCHGEVQDRKAKSQLFQLYTHAQNKHKCFKHGAERLREPA